MICLILVFAWLAAPGVVTAAYLMLLLLRRALMPRTLWRARRKSPGASTSP